MSYQTCLYLSLLQMKGKYFSGEATMNSSCLELSSNFSQQKDQLTSYLKFSFTKSSGSDSVNFVSSPGISVYLTFLVTLMHVVLDRTLNNCVRGACEK